jgi:hypothetical protein
MRLLRVVVVALVVCSVLSNPGVATEHPATNPSLPTAGPEDDVAFSTTSTTYSATLGTGDADDIRSWGGDAASANEVTYDGKRALETDREENANYIYVDVDEGSSAPLSRSALVHVTVEYWNGRDGAFRLEYDGYGDFADDTGAVETTDTEQWQTADFTLTTARFTERLNDGDFRINPLSGSSDVAIRNVTVTIERPKLELRQQRLGNVFLTNEMVAIGLDRYSEPVSWEAQRYDGTVVANGTVEAPDREDAVLGLPLDSTGHYRLFFRDAETGTPLRETSVTVLPPTESDGFERYGVSTHYGQLWNRDVYRLETMQLLDRAGTGTLRDNMNWRDIEQSRGEYAFPEEYDAYVERSERYGIEPFVILAGTNPLYDDGATVHSNEGREAFGEYSRAIVERYDRVEHVEVYNEFNIPRFGDRGDGPANASPEYYAHLVNATSARLDGTGVALVGPATSRVPQEWLAAVFDRGVLRHLDVVSVHPYTAGPPTKVDEKMARVDDLAAEYDGGQTPLWVSENGWSTSKTPAGTSFDDNAGYLVRAQVLAFAEGTERYYTYELIDQGPHRSEHQSNFGLVHTTGDVRGNYAPKPAYTALGVLTRTLEDAPYGGEDEFAGAIESHRFSNPDDNGTVRVMWRPAKTGNEVVEIRTSSAVTVKTITGTTNHLTPSNGTIELTLTDVPIYVYGLGDEPISGYAPATVTRDTTGTQTPPTANASTSAATVNSTPTAEHTSAGESTSTSIPGFTPVTVLLAALVGAAVANRRTG